MDNPERVYSTETYTRTPSLSEGEIEFQVETAEEEVNSNSDSQVWKTEIFTVPSKNAVKRPKVQPTENPEDPIPPERDVNFYNVPEARVVDNILIRPYFDITKEAWMIHFVKKVDQEKVDEKGSSHMSVSAFELGSFVDILRGQIREIALNPFDQKLPRLLLSQFGTVMDSDDPRFWSKEHCDFLPSESIFIRPFQTLEGYFLIRFWMPRKQTVKYANWIGKRISMKMSVAREFVAALEFMQEYVRDMTEQYVLGFN